MKHRIVIRVALVHFVPASLATVAAFTLLLGSPSAVGATIDQHIRLTTIKYALSGAACEIDLDQGEKVYVGGSDYYNDNGAWHIGINGREYRLLETKPFRGVFVLQSRDRKMSVRIRRLQKVWESHEPTYPADKYRVAVSIGMNRTTTTVIAFMKCGDG